MDKEEKIIWLHGKPTNEDENNKMNRIKSYIKDNIWNFFSAITALATFAIQWMHMIMATMYSRDLGQYYGVDMKYFESNPIALNNLKNFAAICLAVLIPFLLSRIVRGMKEKLAMGLYFVGTAMIIFYLTTGYIVEILDTILWEWWWSIIDSWIIFIVLSIHALVLAYFFILREMVRSGQAWT